MAIPDLVVEIDESGDTIDNNRISVVDSFVGMGLKGYAVDSIYTEFEYSVYERYIPKKERAFYGNQKKIEAYRVKGVKKSVIKRNRNGEITHFEPLDSNPVLDYSYTINFNYNGIKNQITMGDRFVDMMESFYPDGRLYCRVYYFFNKAGYLDCVRLERTGEDAVYLFYGYSDSHITITEPDGSYHIKLSSRKIDNTGYVCNVLSFEESSLTSKYVFIPELYYQGIYGTPVRYLPDEVIERVVRKNRDGKKGIVLSRVGKYSFFY